MDSHSAGQVAQRETRWPMWVGLVLLAGVFAIYLLTLAPGVLGGDPGEYQFVPYILSMPHPTGTPLYILLSKAWSALPLGPSVAWRLNLLGAISAALAVFVTYHCAYLLVQRIVPALAAALALAYGITFWEQATMADKYAFNALMVALVIYLTLRWGRSRSSTTLYLLALTCGLSLSHHRTAVLFAPSLLGYVWWYERGELWRDKRRLLRLAVLLLAPLLLYLYLPWAERRNLPPAMWHPDSLGQWGVALYDEGWLKEIRVVPAQQLETLGFYVRTLATDFSWIGALLGVAGLVWQVRRRWPDALFLLVNFLLQALLSANYHVPRRWVFFIPSFVIFALWLGEGLGLVWLGAEHLRARWKRAGLAAMVILGVLMLALPLANFRQRYEPHRQAHLGAGVLDVWRQTLKSGEMGDRVGLAIAAVDPGAIIVTDWEQATPLWYYQRVEGLRPDVEIIYPAERLDEAAASGRPLYIARNHPGLADTWHPSSRGPLIALNDEPVRELPAGTESHGIQLGDTIELAGFAYGEAEYYPSTVVPLTLYWRALEAPAYDYSVSIRLFDDTGQELYKVDSQHPVLGTYPTSLWSAGEVVGDY